MPLTTIDGLEVLIVSGTPDDMGYEHGVTLKHSIQAALQDFLRRRIEDIGVGFNQIKDEARRFLPTIPNDFVDEMSALARGAEASFEDVLALNCVVDLHAYHQQTSFHCCNFVLTPPATQHQMVLHGRNLDFRHFGMASKLQIVVVRIPAGDERFATVSVSWAGFVGTLTGYSVHGLSIAEVGVPTPDVRLGGLPIALTIRDVLERAENVPQAVRKLRQAPRTGGYNIAICDGKSGESICVESTPRLLATRKPEKGILIVDDPCLCGRTGSGRLGHSSGVFRYARMMSLVQSSYGKVDVQLAKEFLTDRFDMSTWKDGDNYNCICNRDTIQSVLFDHGSAKVHISHSATPAPRGVHTELDLRVLMRDDAHR